MKVVIKKSCLVYISIILMYFVLFFFTLFASKPSTTHGIERKW